MRDALAVFLADCSVSGHDPKEAAKEFLKHRKIDFSFDAGPMFYTSQIIYWTILRDGDTVRTSLYNNNRYVTVYDKAGKVERADLYPRQAS